MCQISRSCVIASMSYIYIYIYIKMFFEDPAQHVHISALITVLTISSIEYYHLTGIIVNK